jgi:hypothetical protein
VSDLADYTVPDGYGTTIGKCLTFAEIEGLLAAERERCAAVAEEFGSGRPWWDAETVRFEVAREIRNLPPQTEGSEP